MARLDPERTERAADVTGADGGDLQRLSRVLRARQSGRKREQRWNADGSTENSSAVMDGRNSGHFQLLASPEPGMQSAIFCPARLHLAGEERIGQPLLADGRAGAMA